MHLGLLQIYINNIYFAGFRQAHFLYPLVVHSPSSLRPGRGKQGAARASCKTRITIRIDDDVIEAFRAKAEAAGRGYQTLVNEALRAALAENDRPLTAKVTREIVREELAHAR